MKIDTNMKKKASKVDQDKNESGWGSIIEGCVADEPRKLRGARTYSLFFEEAGSNPKLIDTYILSRALVVINGYRVGTRYIFGCICPGTKVWTRDGLYINIEELQQFDGIYGFKDGKSNLEYIMHQNKIGVKSCVRIECDKDQYLECSTDHPILTRVTHRKRSENGKRRMSYTWEFKEAKDLKPSDVIAQCDKINAFGKMRLFDPYLVGLLIGDSNYKDESINFSTYNTEILDYINDKYSCKSYKNEICIKDISNEILDLYPSKIIKQLPDINQCLTREDTVLLLSGLFDANGFVDYKQKQIVLTSCDKQLLEQIKILLYKFGVYSNILQKKHILRADRIYQYNLVISDGLSIKNFKDEISLKVVYKQKALNNINTDKYNSTGIRELRVKRIVDVGRQPIFNLTTGDSHTYLANNIITHNTAGDSTPNLAGLKDMFYNPEEYFMLPYKNNYTQDGRTVFTGYFIPSYTMWFGTPDNLGFDHRGVVDEARAKKYYMDSWEKIKDPMKRIKDKAEYCFTPEDAFILEGSNQFDQELLVEQLHNIELHKTVEPPKCIKLHWKVKDGTMDRDSYPEVEFCDQSKMKIIEMPLKDENHVPYKNLYCAGIDAIDLDSSTSTGLTDVSEFCAVIYRRQFGLQPPKVVAIYKERPRHIQTAFDNAMKLCAFYNALMLVEATRISIKQYFEQHHKLHWLMRRPKSTANTYGKTNYKQYGVPASDHIIEHQLDLIEQYIVDYSEEIQFPEMLHELIEYSYQNKRKFDIVAAFGIALLADEEMAGKIARPAQAYSPDKMQFGYVRNQYGQVEFKILNKKQDELQPNFFGQPYLKSY